MDNLDTILEKLFRSAVENKASDIHLIHGTPPVFRIGGTMIRYDLDGMEKDFVRPALKKLIGETELIRVEAGEEVDAMIEFPGIGRFRTLAYRHDGVPGATFRVIPDCPVPSPDELGLPAVVSEMVQQEDGLILICGPTASGKTTTLASLVSTINRTRNAHIITIEDPVEYTITSEMSLVRQREIKRDTTSFDRALRYSLRADPDVVVVSEVRTIDTIMALLTIAETGHLVIAALHTPTPRETIERVIDSFPPHQQLQVRKQLASTLRGIVAQKLVVAAGTRNFKLITEVMGNSSGISEAIREYDLKKIDELIDNPASGDRSESFAACRERLGL